MEWIPRILLLVNRISIHHAPYYLYRQNNNSIMHNFSEKNVSDLIRIIESLQKQNKLYNDGTVRIANHENILPYWIAMIFFVLVGKVVSNIYGRKKKLNNIYEKKILNLSKVLVHGYGYKNMLLYVYLKIFKLNVTVYTINLINSIRKNTW
jgi:hypothetical protein